MRILHFVLGLFFFFEVSASAQVQVWINPNPAGKDGSRTGSLPDPYICSSAATFDALMKSPAIPDNSMVQLMAGIFLTKGSIPLKAGWKFRGAGIDITTIQIVPFTSYTTPYGTLSNYEARVIGIPPLTYYGNGVEVSDLTVDCNLQNQPLAIAIGAVWLQGGNTKISRVKAINWGSKNTSVECFIFGIGSGGEYFPAVSRCLIENCVVEQPALVPQRQGADGFVIVGGPALGDQLVVGSRGWILGAEIRNCRVHDINTGKGAGEPEYFSGMGIGNGVSGARIDGNMAMNLGGNNSAVYDSCGSLVNCRIENNLFLNVGNGVSFAANDYCPANTNALKENILVRNNLITVQTGGNGAAVSGIFGHALANLVITHNLIQAADGAGAIHGIQVATVKNLTVQNNVLDANGGLALGIAKDVTVSRITNNPNFNLK